MANHLYFTLLYIFTFVCHVKKCIFISENLDNAKESKGPEKSKLVPWFTFQIFTQHFPQHWQLNSHSNALANLKSPAVEQRRQTHKLVFQSGVIWTLQEHRELCKPGIWKVFNRRQHTNWIEQFYLFFSSFLCWFIRRRESSRCFDWKSGERKYLGRRLEPRAWNTCEGVGLD